MSQFRIGEILKTAWGIFKEKMLFVWLVFAIIWGVSLFFGLLQKRVGEESIFGLLVALVSLVASIILQLGLIRIYLDLIDKKDTKVETLFSEYQHFFRYIVASILYGLVVIIGLIFFIVPGIYLALRYSFYSYFIIDKNVGILESLQKSSELTRGNKWKILLFLLVICGINILGLLFFVVGLLFTIPITSIAFSVLYRTLLNPPKTEPIAPILPEPHITPLQ